MRTKFKLDNPGEMEATLNITMQLKEWQDLRDQLPKQYPALDLSSVITEVIMQAEKVFFARSQKEE